jgi:hypothetical protein
MKRLFLLLLGAIVLAGGADDAFAGAQKKKPKAIVRFHPQAANEGGNFSIPVQNLHTGRPSSMGKIPLVTEEEIVSFSAVRVADGTYGVCFKLDYHGTNLLSQHTMSRRGTWVFGFLNGRHVIDLYVDRPVKDGEICFPSGITEAELALIEQTFPRTGHEKGRSSGKKPADSAQ